MDLLLLGFSFVDLRLLGLSEPFDTDFLLLPLLLFLFSSFFLLLSLLYLFSFVP